MVIENKYTKYILYAIGEVFLVMIGILLAFQVSNWKEGNENKILEEQMLDNLNSEFRTNLIKIEESISEYEKNEEAIRFLMSKMKLPSADLQKYNIDSLIAASVDVYEYHPTQNALTEILSTGKLKLITDDSLKYELLNWSSEFNELNEAWETLDDFNQHMVIPYLTENISMRNIDKYSLMKWEEKSRFSVDYEKTFNDIKFENHLDNLGWAVVNYINVLIDLREILNKIIMLTDD